MAVGLMGARNLSQLSRRTPGVDVVLLGLLLAFLGMLMLYGRQVSGTYDRAVPIDLSIGALPGYVALSLARCLAAFILSLAFTLVWGSIAATLRAIIGWARYAELLDYVAHDEVITL